MGSALIWLRIIAANFWRASVNIGTLRISLAFVFTACTVAT
jgi:hypothetical protein